MTDLERPYSTRVEWQANECAANFCCGNTDGLRETECKRQRQCFKMDGKCRPVDECRTPQPTVCVLENVLWRRNSSGVVRTHANDVEQKMERRTTGIKDAHKRCWLPVADFGFDNAPLHTLPKPTASSEWVTTMPVPWTIIIIYYLWHFCMCRIEWGAGLASSPHHYYHNAVTGQMEKFIPSSVTMNK